MKDLPDTDEVRSLAYWTRYLSGYDTISGLRQAAGHPGKAYEPKMAQFRVDGGIRGELLDYCRQMRITEDVFILGLWGMLLGRYNGAGDVVFGMILPSRSGESAGGAIENTVPVRVRIGEDQEVRELLQTLQREAIEGSEHHSLRLAELQALTSLGSHLFDHVLQFQDFPLSEDKGNGLKTSKAYVSAENCVTGSAECDRYDLTCKITCGAAILFELEYNGSIFDERLSEQLEHHLVQLIKEMIRRPDVKAGDLELLNAQERRRLLEEFCPGRGEYPTTLTIVQLFEEQVKLSSESLAVVCGGRSITYRELNEKANVLAGYLQSMAGVLPEDRVGILLDRSEYWILSLIAVLKCGAAYVPLDPDNPAFRKELVLRDTAVKILISNTDHLRDIPGYTGTSIAIDLQPEVFNGPYTVTPVNFGPETTAYIIFTSGSAGQPKGVMISHRSLVDYVFGIRERTNIGTCMSFGLVSTPAADLGNTTLYTALLTGGRLHVFSSEDVMETSVLAAADLDCIKIVPCHWRALQNEPALFMPRRTLIFGGEQLTADVLSMIRQEASGCEVYNHYGPTETTIGKLLMRVDQLADLSVIPVGKPFCKSQVYITDLKGRLCPIGIPGEIRIAGDGVAQGYWEDPVLTSRKFIQNRYGQADRVYLTGDRGRWLPDGSIEFLGRIDEQVKIRGYRVEPGEIASKLSAFKGIDASFVTPITEGDGERALVAYFVSSFKIDETMLQSFLERQFPSYLLPRYYVNIPEIPLTPNGKVNRKKLPMPTTR